MLVATAGGRVLRSGSISDILWRQEGTVLDYTALGEETLGAAV